MSTATETIEGFVKQEYKYGFITDIEADTAPPGLNEDIIRFISARKNEPEWLTEWRLKAYRHWTNQEAACRGTRCPPRIRGAWARGSHTVRRSKSPSPRRAR